MTMSIAMKRYKITDMGPKNMFAMLKEPSIKQCNDTIKEIRKQMRENPSENFLIIYVLAGHGMQLEGN